MHRIVNHQDDIRVHDELNEHTIKHSDNKHTSMR